eukprot:gene30361-36401_t
MAADSVSIAAPQQQQQQQDDAASLATDAGEAPPQTRIAAVAADSLIPVRFI